jgi:hypothetical protein
MRQLGAALKPVLRGMELDEVQPDPQVTGAVESRPQLALPALDQRPPKLVERGARGRHAAEHRERLIPQEEFVGRECHRARLVDLTAHN